ncbi:MAG: hypothetical protein CVT64_06520 [Actinobacteria bacterium HGW-Actinobacteria-4]|nr:MAG: hypothetical protein CVT64_06520 [Actinobacteria bacterium HGW-Actinobacteria-4]
MTTKRNGPVSDRSDDVPPMVDPQFLLANERTYLSWIRTAVVT